MSEMVHYAPVTNGAASLISISSLSLASAALASGALAIASLGERGGLSVGAVLVVAPFALAALTFAGAVLTWPRDRQRGRLLAVGAAIVLGAWVVAVGYGRLELASGVVAILGGLAAATTMLGVGRLRFGLLAMGIVVVVALVVVRSTHPPAGLIATYVIAAIGMSAATLGVLLPLVRRGAAVVLAVIAVAAWAVCAALLLLTFGPPLAGS